MIEGGGRAAGYFTGATGVTIYTGDAWPREFVGNAFIGDVGSNLVHRKIIERDANAIPLKAKRATPNREFIASTDTWFRPVQFANGPDGNLYVLDMYREVIEHPASLPPVLKKHLDLTSGRDRGRIYRVVHTENSPAARREGWRRDLPGNASTQDLVAMLTHKNGWHRTTAARLLFERNDPAAAKHLAKVLHGGYGASGRIRSAYLLAHSKDFFPILNLGDRDPDVARHAARIIGTQLRSLSAQEQTATDYFVTPLVNQASGVARAFRFEVALALGETTNPIRLDGLAKVLRKNPEDPYIAAAVYSSLAKDAEKFIALLLEDTDFSQSSAGRRHVIELCRQMGARGDANELTAIARIAAVPPNHLQELVGEMLIATVRGAGASRRKVREQLSEATGGKSDETINLLVQQSLRTAGNEAADPAARVAAIATLPLAEFQIAEPLLTELLAPRHPQNVQLAALAALGEFRDADVAPIILAAYGGMGPTLRLQAAELLISRAATARLLLATVERGEISARDLDPSTIQRLKTHADATVSQQAAALLQDVAPKRTEVVDAHQDVLQLAGDPAHGRDVFKNNCTVCHRKNGEGVEVGADLATVVTRSPEALLMSILDPNREVDPKFVQYTVLTVDGLVKSGMIAGETATSITLKRQENLTETIPRADIEQLTSTKMTLMPEGLEKQIDKQSLADLIAYLRTSD
jgi:putative heme-binding domain-containing protein